MRRSRFFAYVGVCALLVGALALVGISGAAAGGTAKAPGGTRGTLLYRGSTSLRAAAKPLRPSGERVGGGLTGYRTNDVRTEGDGGQTPAPPPDTVVTRGVPVENRHPEVVQSFLGLNHFAQRFANGGNQFSIEPPDQGLCVGNGFVLETINSVLQVFDTGGSPATDVVDLNTFYGYPAQFDRTSFLQGPFVTDPTCLYDKDTGRWFHTILTLDVDPVSGDFLGTNHLDIAVSRTSDPTRRWDLYSIPAQNDGTQGTPDHGCVGSGDTGHGPCFGDFPQIGIDRNGFYVTTEEYTLFGSTQYTGSNLYAMSKDLLTAGGPSVPFVLFGPLQVPELGQPAFVPFPANGTSSDWSPERGGTMFFVSTTASTFELGGDGISNTLVVWALSNTSQLNNDPLALRLRHVVVDSQQYGIPVPAEQKAGPTPLQDCFNLDCFGFGTPPTPEVEKFLDGGDSRTGDATIARGSLYVAWTTFVLVDGDVRDGIAYAQIEPSFTAAGLTATTSLRGVLAAPGENLIYPSIALNHGGEGFIGMTIAGVDRFPGLAYASVGLGRRPTLVRVAAKGLGPDDGFTGTFLTGPDSRTRWGDYGAAAVGANGTIWIAGEYIAQTCTLDEYLNDTSCGGTRSALANWATRVVQLQP